jgi:Cupredoxin-like domain
MLRLFTFLLFSFTAGQAFAANDELTLLIENHKFQPAELRMPANTKIKLVIENRDATAEEFESHALNREKLVPAKGKATIYVGPIAAGRYPFFGDFNQSTAQGVLIVE